MLENQGIFSMKQGI